ncbi:DUF493 family protein YbeD [Candidatus Erwinia haradaeae]|uniref:UPF0250 protein ERCIKOCA2762_357 n=1 Tax=Candidatus Erwinia haradaeae TaxID=1922217 RepID=A0A451D9Y2_9GAMM|nr:DUF493 family protein YbeD [Candidatus Erwinia haradaeae]VFP83116.1 UPF0250 protein YbeD [Candidatus Erwinia haradaeae]
MKTNLRDLLAFPTLFTYKVIGFAHADLPGNIVKIVQDHAPGQYFPSIKISSKKNYYSISITITAHNIQQVETLYNALSKIKAVRIVL